MGSGIISMSLLTIYLDNLDLIVSLIFLSMFLKLFGNFISLLMNLSYLLSNSFVSTKIYLIQFFLKSWSKEYLILLLISSIFSKISKFYSKNSSASFSSVSLTSIWSESIKL